MANYKISGVWKNTSGVITHYAFHAVNQNGTSRGVKTTKSEAVRLLSNTNNRGVTWIWDYQTAGWTDGEQVEAVAGEYLRSNPDKKVTDNLAHLINYDWLQQ